MLAWQRRGARNSRHDSGGTVLDAKRVLRNAVVAVDGSRIVKVANGAAETTRTISRASPSSRHDRCARPHRAHFGKDGRASTPGGDPR